MSRELRNASARTPFLITASQKVGISVGKYQEFCNSQAAPSAALLLTRFCGSRLTKPIPFPGADSRRCGAIPGRLRFAVSLSHRDFRHWYASVQKIDHRLGSSLLRAAAQEQI